MRLIGRWRLGARIALGGSAEVYDAFDGQKRVVLKILLPHLAEDPEAVGAFEAEAELFGALGGPHVPRLLDAGSWLGAPWFALEHAGDVSLRAFLDARRGRPAPAHLVAAIGHRLATALVAVHGLKGADGHPRGLVHRDVTPSNVILSADGRLCLIDFGLARETGAERRTATGVVKGKHAYLSPEQIRREPVDARTDLHAVGAILCELATGTPAYAGDDVLDTFERILAGRRASSGLLAIHPRLDAVIESCLATQPALRPNDAAALAVALGELFEPAEPGPASRAAIASALVAHAAAPPHPFHSGDST